jgi:hypothetical protein
LTALKDLPSISTSRSLKAVYLFGFWTKSAPTDSIILIS